MKHTVRQRILGAILFGALLLGSGSEGVCQGTCSPDDPNCGMGITYADFLDRATTELQFELPQALPAAPQPKPAALPQGSARTNFSGGELGNMANAIGYAGGNVQSALRASGNIINGNDLGNYLNGAADRLTMYENLEALGNAELFPAKELGNLVNKINGTNKSLEELTAQDFKDAAKKSKEAQEQEEEEEEEGEGDTDHNPKPQTDKDKTPTPGSCPNGGCSPGGGCPGGNCNPGGGAGAAGFGGKGGILGGIAQMAQQMLPQLIQGVLQGILQGGGQQGGGQQNGYDSQQLPPDLYPNDADVMRQVEATQTAVYAEATALAEQALQATATAEAMTPEEQDEEISESQPEGTPIPTPITSPTKDPMISGL